MTSLSVHSLLLPDAKEVDHEDHNGLNNRRLNLRPASHAQNVVNTKKGTGFASQYKGVCWDKRWAKWYARVQSNGRKVWLGRFSSEVSAARAYDVAALELHGPFALLNFPTRKKAA
jgi:hypothetical protein